MPNSRKILATVTTSRQLDFDQTSLPDLIRPRQGAAIGSDAGIMTLDIPVSWLTGRAGLFVSGIA